MSFHVIFCFGHTSIQTVTQVTIALQCGRVSVFLCQYCLCTLPD